MKINCLNLASLLLILPLTNFAADKKMSDISLDLDPETKTVVYQGPQVELRFLDVMATLEGRIRNKIDAESASEKVDDVQHVNTNFGFGASYGTIYLNQIGTKFGAYYQDLSIDFDGQNDLETKNFIFDANLTYGIDGHLSAMAGVNFVMVNEADFADTNINQGDFVNKFGVQASLKYFNPDRKTSIGLSYIAYNQEIDYAENINGVEYSNDTMIRYRGLVLDVGLVF
ncbi:hypothetical protein N9N67_01690 [Bacteriovoracaceae bacterium]|nr:hypothetical protein [Bacteriovoracaceae bacterium]